jgi:hypothetical protein
VSIGFRRNLTLSDRFARQFLAGLLSQEKAVKPSPIFDLPGFSDIDDLRRQKS